MSQNGGSPFEGVSLEELREQFGFALITIVVLLRRLGGKAVIPIEEIEEAKGHTLVRTEDTEPEQLRLWVVKTPPPPPEVGQ